MFHTICAVYNAVADSPACFFCREQALELLKRGWPPGDEPRYDPDHALMLCRMAGFKLGLIFLYENLRLFREVLQVRRGNPHIGRETQTGEDPSFTETSLHACFA